MWIRWELWSTFLINILGSALQFGLVPKGGKWESAVLFAIQGLGSIGLIFGKQLAGKPAGAPAMVSMSPPAQPPAPPEAK